MEINENSIFKDSKALVYMHNKQTNQKMAGRLLNLASFLTTALLNKVQTFSTYLLIQSN